MNNLDLNVHNDAALMMMMMMMMVPLAEAISRWPMSGLPK